MKKRERRRYLTEKYQQKQIRLGNLYRHYRPYDSERYIQRKSILKRRFYDELCGNIVGITWKPRERRFRLIYMLNSGWDIDPYTNAQVGRFRNHSWRDCGRSRCPGCSNPRRVLRNKLSERLTLQEQKALQSFHDDWQDYISH